MGTQRSRTTGNGSHHGSVPRHLQSYRDALPPAGYRGRYRLPSPWRLLCAPVFGLGSERRVLDLLHSLGVEKL